MKTTISARSTSLQRSMPEYFCPAKFLQEFCSPRSVEAEVFHSPTGSSQDVRPHNQILIAETISVTKKREVPLSSLFLARTTPLQVSEPIAPENTPTDISYFDAYAGREPPAKASKIEEESRLVKNHTDSSLSTLSNSSIGRACVENEPFASVPAFQVSEKLKHSSAEQRENPSDQPTKTKEEEDATQCQTSDDCDDSKLTSAEEKNNTTHIIHLFTHPQASLLETSQGGM